jgi:hypothetical protein
MKPAAAVSLALLEVYILLLREELVKMIPAARKKDGGSCAMAHRVEVSRLFIRQMTNRRSECAVPRRSTRKRADD